ncbi:hypothetical protein O6R05_07060 [Peptoniphilus equinus]|uniref:Alpha/beta hydrolase n=1 Tax=Peptoniphilus equinus TaxID=3016343 RepID=A0ABY7QTZ3_9FIRM|nr:hypothetical protein [Peptoniphilus equinus]WBW49755.1 hypothetical protein O6R05_07060 [Peptoniphilus equinus]
MMRIKELCHTLYLKLHTALSLRYTKKNTAYHICVFFLAMVAASSFYYYLEFLPLPTPVQYGVMSLGFFLIFELGTALLRLVTGCLRQLTSQSLALMVLSLAVWGVTLHTMADTLDLDDLHVIFAAVCLSALTTLFTRSLAAVKNGYGLPKLTLFVTALGLGLIAAASFYPGRATLTKHFKGTKTLDAPILFAASHTDYEGPGVNLNSLVHVESFDNKVRRAYFGRGFDNVKMAGRLWLPETDQPVPLVVLAHGNHRFTTASHLGYDYLGSYLARRGYAFASVDMTMLNSAFKLGIGNENDARAKLLTDNATYLIHDSDYAKALSGEVVFMGHSRGGEAAAIAASFAELQYNPDTGDKLERTLKPRGVITLAATMGQYEPSGKPLTLHNNLLAIHGAGDTDVDNFEALGLYNRTVPPQGGLKSAVYLAYADHSNFNTTWDYDTDPPDAFFLNHAQRLEQAAQQTVTEELVLAFLNQIFYRETPQDFFQVPETYEGFEYGVWSRVAYPGARLLADFEEDYDLITFPYGSVRFSGSVTEEGDDAFDGTALRLSKGASYTLDFSEPVQAAAYLSLDIKPETDSERDFEGVDITVEDKSGHTRTVNTDTYRRPLGEVTHVLYKSDLITHAANHRNGFDTVRVPLADATRDGTVARITLKAKDSAFIDTISLTD